MTKGIFKCLTLMMAIGLCSAKVHAQKGSWYAGGQAGYNSRTEKNTGSPDIKTRNWAFAPEVGTFLENNLQLGMGLNLSGSKAGNGIDSTTTRFSPVVYLRRFFKIDDRFSTFVGLVGNVTTGSAKAGNLKYDLSGWGANISLGAAYALSSRFTAVGQYGLLGYTSQTTKLGSFKNKVNDLGLSVNSLGPVFNVGLYWTFKK
jgi:hypothetical protein